MKKSVVLQMAILNKLTEIFQKKIINKVIRKIKMLKNFKKKNIFLSFQKMNLEIIKMKVITQQMFKEMIKESKIKVSKI